MFSRRRRVTTRVLALAIAATGCLLVAGEAATPAGAVTAAIPLRVLQVSPNSGSVAGGTTVSVLGSGFKNPLATCNQPLKVAFGAQPGNNEPQLATSVRVVSDTRLLATTPASFAGRVAVQVGTACNLSAPSLASAFTYSYRTSECASSGACGITVGRSSGRRLTHVASGFLNGDVAPPTPLSQQLMALLQPKSWRIGNSDPAVLQAVNKTTPHSTLILESDWLTCHTCGDVTRPWTNLAGFARFTTNDVLNRLANHTAPGFWDVWNEPSAIGSADQWLQVYDTAYKAIKAADPSARVVGPSIPAFRITPPADPTVPGSILDLKSFAAYAQAHGDKFDAISYHDEGNSGGEPIYSPAQLTSHARVLRQLLAQYPLLANAKIFVNEYGPVYAMSQPGWIVGDMAALERSGVSQANLTCPTDSACRSYYDGLIGQGSQPQLPYWLYLNYAAMSGKVLKTHGVSSDVTALAVHNPKNRTITMLVGRHDECGPPPLPYLGGPVPTNTCMTPAVTGARSLRVPVSVRMHWAHRATASVRILGHAMSQPLGDNPVLNQPASRQIPVRLVNGRAQFDLGSLANGDAAIVVLQG